MVNKEQGGIVGFAVVALVLAGLLLGGLFLSKHEARIAHDTNTSQPQVTVNKPVESPSASDTSDTPEKSSPQQPATTPKTANPQSPSAAPTPAKPVPAQGQNSPVPATGPTETLAGMLMFGGLTYATVRYLQSRSLLRASSRQ